MIAALYVIRDGPYYGLPNVDPWDERRDAREYAGPWPVVAHPPCARWGRYWSGGPSHHGEYELGNDDGCFEAALASVRRWGGVLEHPEASHAWARFCLPRPDRRGGWVPGLYGGASCCVEQGHYGHAARKATWLYAVGLPALPELRWGTSGQRLRLDDGFASTAARRRAVRTGRCQRLSRRQRQETPAPFRDLLIGMAESAGLARTPQSAFARGGTA